MKLVLGMEVGLSPGVFVLDGDPVPFPKRGRSPLPNFRGPFLLWPNGWMHQDATWHGCRPQPRGLCVRWRTIPPDKVAEPPQKFSAHVYCGQTAGWIKMPLCMEVGRRPRPTRHCVRCGPSYPRKKWHTHSHPVFDPCILWPNGWMDEDAANWYGSRPRLRPHCSLLHRVPAPAKGAQHPPCFRPMSIVATVAHLSYC